MDLNEMGCNDVDCIRLVEDWDHWWVLVSTAVNLCIS
jgi:hypothetical protein